MNINRKTAILLSVVVALACAVTAVAEPLAPASPDSWSEPVNKLAGRLRVSESRITVDQHFQISLELANRGHIPLAVQCGNPHIITITLFDSAGKPVKPTSARVDVLSSPQWGVIPGRAYLGFPVSIQSQDGAKGSHLDITTLIWELSPGKYRVVGEFASGRAADFMGIPGKAEIWEGRIELPSIDIEVIDKEYEPHNNILNRISKPPLRSGFENG
jgi:hypothetical protein